MAQRIVSAQASPEWGPEVFEVRFAPDNAHGAVFVRWFVIGGEMDALPVQPAMQVCGEHQVKFYQHKIGNHVTPLVVISEVERMPD